MMWPDVERIIEAINNNDNILDASIKGLYTCVQEEIRRRGRVTYQPFVEMGGFAVAFCLENKRDKSHKIYMRVYKRYWNETVENSEGRYNKISRYISEHRAVNPYFVNFSFKKELLKVEGQNLPGVIMNRVDGVTLGKFIHSQDNSRSASVFKSLTQEFYKMCETLYDNGMAHGDLSFDNILVTPDNRIQLVDYDSVYVPTMGSDYLQSTPGVENFQHPQRKNTAGLKASKDDDNFSILVIYLFLQAITHDLSILDLTSVDEIFNSGAFASESSLKAHPVYAKIAKIDDRETQDALNLLIQAINGSLSEVPSLIKAKREKEGHGLGEILDILNTTPKYVPYCVKCGQKFASPTDKYCTRCGYTRLTFSKT